MWNRNSSHRNRHSAGSPVSFAVVEPGTTTLRLCVVEVDDGQATVLGWAEGPGWIGNEADASSLVSSCDEALVQAEQMARASGERWLLPDQLIVGLPASQLRGRSWAIMQQRPESGRPVDERELESLLERTLRLAVNRLVSDTPEDPAWLLLDAVPVVLTVDGRGVTDPVGFRGRELGAAVFAAMTRLGVVQTWGAVAKELEFSSLTLTATPIALAAGLPEAHGILIDIGGATTDLVWCSAGRPVVLESLPVGGQALTVALARKWGLTAGKAERLKRAYTSRKLSAEAESQVQGVLWPALLRWLEDTEVAMSRLSHDEPLPQQLYVLGGGSAVPEMIEALRSLAWSQRLRFKRYPEVSCLRPTDVPRVANRTGKGRGLGDVSALALASWVAGQQRSSDLPARILSELCQG